MEQSELTTTARELDGKSPTEIIEWAHATFGAGLAVGTSLGAEAMVVMDMVSRVAPKLPFVFLDTGFHFAETLNLAEQAKKRYGINLVVARSEISPARQAAEHGDQLFFRDPSLCCEVRKIEPMRRALAPFTAWITGMRRDQTHQRSNLSPVSWDAKFGIVKVCPMLDWSWKQVEDYLHAHDVPYNRLHDMGYASIGCAPCTRPVKPGEDPRAGRWAGFDKTECGLHGGGI